MHQLETCSSNWCASLTLRRLKIAQLKRYMLPLIVPLFHRRTLICGAAIVNSGRPWVLFLSLPFVFLLAASTFHHFLRSRQLRLLSGWSLSGDAGLTLCMSTIKSSQVEMRRCSLVTNCRTLRGDTSNPAWTCWGSPPSSPFDPVVHFVLTLC